VSKSTKVKLKIKQFFFCVAGDDFRFARLIRGAKHIAYAEAGDCYSNLPCPQGRFSVNLSGTPFRVAPTTGWISNGGSMDQQPDEVN
jgi:GON domain